MRKHIFLFTGLAAMAALIWMANLSCKGMEEIVSGSVTNEGRLLDESGKLYSMTGDKADELKAKAGQKVEIKGTVKDRQGERTISVTEYILLNDSPMQNYPLENYGPEQDAMESAEIPANDQPMPDQPLADDPGPKSNLE